MTNVTRIILYYEVFDYDIPGSSNPKKRRRKQQVRTQKLVTGLDSYEINDTESLGHNLSDINY